VLGGRLLEERLVPAGRRVSIGTSARNTLSLPVSGLPRRQTLFEGCSGGHRLRIGPGLEGRVVLEGRLWTLEALGRQGLADGGPELDPGARGKLRLGEVTVLFQRVAAPPARPRPQLPASVRQGLLRGVDWVLASCLVTLGVLHLGFLGYLRNLDPEPMHSSAQTLAPYIPVMPDPQRPAIEIAALEQVGPAPEKRVPKRVDSRRRKGAGKTARRPPRPCDAACKEARAERRRIDLARRMHNTGLLRILASRGSGSRAVDDLLPKGSPDTEMAKAFKGLSDLTVTRSGGGLDRLRRAHSGTGRFRGIVGIGPRIQGPRQVETGGEVKERVPLPQVRQAPPKVTGPLDSASVYSVLRRGARCIKLQYGRALKHDPRLSGKLSLCLTIDIAGRVTGVEVDEDTLGNPILLGGARSCVSRLRFPPSSRDSAEICAPFILRPATR
jgi:hypothetical protein